MNQPTESSMKNVSPAIEQHLRELLTDPKQLPVATKLTICVDQINRSGAPMSARVRVAATNDAGVELVVLCEQTVAEGSIITIASMHKAFEINVG